MPRKSETRRKELLLQKKAFPNAKPALISKPQQLNTERQILHNPVKGEE
jgi:hypothetical protein